MSTRVRTGTKAKGGSEHDTFCRGCRKHLTARAGTRKASKQTFNRRVRRKAREELR